jgi:hypothetical protein
VAAADLERPKDSAGERSAAEGARASSDGSRPTGASGAALAVNRTGRIDGQVSDPSGAPLAGARVEAARLDARVLGLEDSLAEALRGWGDAQIWQRAELSGSLISARTDAAGRYELAVEAEASHLLRASLPGHRLQRRDGRFSRVQAGESVDFLAEPLGLLVLDPVDASGKPLPSATLAFSFSEQGYVDWVYVDWQRSEPEVDLPPGAWLLVALDGARPWCPDRTVPWLAEALSEPVQIDVRPGQQLEPLRLELRPRPTLYGEVRPASGESLPDQNLCLRLFGSDGTALPVFPPQILGSFRPGIDFYSPRFALIAPAPGRFEVRWIRGGSEADLSLGFVELPEGLLRQDLTLPAGSHIGPLVIVATDPDGAPAASLGPIQFSTRDPRGLGQGGSLQNPRPTGGGRFELPLNAHLAAFFSAGAEAPVPAGAAWGAGGDQPKASLHLQHPRFGPHQVELERGRFEYRVEFRSPAALEVKVSGLLPAPEGRFYGLEVVPAGGKDPFGGLANRESLSVSDNGTASVSFPRLPPGRYAVVLQLNLGGRNLFNSEELYTRSVDLVAGPNQLLLDLGGSGQLRVRCQPGAEAGLVLKVQEADPGQFGLRSRQRSPTSSADGVQIFENVMPGAYMLSSHAGHMRIQFPCGEVLFDPRPTNALELLLLRPDGALAQAGLSSGDLLLGVDGSAIQPGAQMEWSKATLQDPQRSVTVRILRQGSPIELELQLAQLFRQATSGAFLTETLRP